MSDTQIPEKPTTLESLEKIMAYVRYTAERDAERRAQQEPAGEEAFRLPMGAETLFGEPVDLGLRKLQCDYS